MTNLWEVVQTFRTMTTKQRLTQLDAIISRAFCGDERLMAARLDFNARLVTALREEKLWPPKG